jgi:hypothetical protein
MLDEAQTASNREVIRLSTSNDRRAVEEDRAVH